MTTGELIDKYGWPPSIWPEEYRPKDNCLLLLQEIRQEISVYKDDKIIHEERNEMIDIILEIINKHIKEFEE